MAKRLIDAEALRNGIALYVTENAYLNDTPLDALKMVADWVTNAPTVEVARCRDCKYIYFNKAYNSYLCRNTNGLTSHLKADYFCSYGERRTNE